MEDSEYAYWEINYISCEGNPRWTIARTPIDWDHYDLNNHITQGGVGDDIATITSIEETVDKSYSYDYCN